MSMCEGLSTKQQHLQQLTFPTRPVEQNSLQFFPPFLQEKKILLPLLVTLIFLFSVHQFLPERSFLIESEFSLRGSAKPSSVFGDFIGFPISKHTGISTSQAADQNLGPVTGVVSIQRENDADKFGPPPNSNRYLYYGKAVDDPVPWNSGLSHQISGIRCAAEEAMLLNRTFILPRVVFMSPLHQIQSVPTIDPSTSEILMETILDISALNETMLEFGSGVIFSDSLEALSVLEGLEESEKEARKRLEGVTRETKRTRRKSNWRSKRKNKKKLISANVSGNEPESAEGNWTDAESLSPQCSRLFMWSVENGWSSPPDLATQTHFVGKLSKEVRKSEMDRASRYIESSKNSDLEFLTVSDDYVTWLDLRGEAFRKMKLIHRITPHYWCSLCYKRTESTNVSNVLSDVEYAPVLHQLADKISESMQNNFSIVFVRRGDKLWLNKLNKTHFPHLERDTRPEALIKKLLEWVPKKGTLYVASNEATKGYFDPLKEVFKVVTLGDVAPFFESVSFPLTNYHVFAVELLLAKRAKVFVQTFQTWQTPYFLCSDPMHGVINATSPIL